MHIEQITNLEALLGMLAIIMFAGLIFRIVPPVGETTGDLRTLSEADLRAHDASLPKYLLVTTLALMVGAIHLAVRSIPAVANWLASGGYGGHLLRDIAYSHMMIVMGGTIAVTGLTWYCLPRILGRPLYSRALADLAFWGTVVGAAGFYLANSIFGGIMAAMVHRGWTQTQIDDTVGLWKSLSVGLSATIMGVGYWTYVANVLITALAGKLRMTPRPNAHLAKFFVVGAAGLFVGTVQGVLQVIPENVDWLHRAGVAGHFIDPVSHAHVNLITGVLSIVAGTLFLLTRTPEDLLRQRRSEQIVFWVLIPASIAFYVIFVFLGFREGKMIVDEGMTFDAAANSLGWLHTVPLAVTGTLTFAGILLFLSVVLGRLFRSQMCPRLAILAGALALSVGTTQGLIQVMPSVRDWMLEAGPVGSAIANAHMHVNIVGGILMLLLGAMFAVGEPITVGRVPHMLVRRASIFMGGGALVYYCAAIVSAIFAIAAIHRGLPTAGVLDRMYSQGAVGMIVGAMSYALGAAVLARWVWRTTAAPRAKGWRSFKVSFAQNDSSAASWRRRIPKIQIVVPELVAGLFGFPGLGWILSGRAMVGVPLMMGGAAVSWAIIPLLLSPYSSGGLPHLTPAALETYLIVSAILSSALLLVVMISSGRARHEAEKTGRTGWRESGMSVGKTVIAGFAILLLLGGGQSRAWELTNIRGALPSLDFTMTRASDGKTVDAGEYRGKVVLLFFGYTSCPDICPMTMLNIQSTLQSLGTESDQIRVLFVTVDPMRDTLPVLDEFSGSFGPQFVGLRGSANELARLAKRFRVAYSVSPAHDGKPYRVTHGSGIYVFDREGEASLLLTSLSRRDDEARTIVTKLRNVVTGKGKRQWWRELLAVW